MSHTPVKPPTPITSRRSLEQRKADQDVKRMVRSQAHLLLDRIMDPNIDGIVAHVVAGRQVSLTMGFVNPDGTPWTPPEEKPQPSAAPAPVIVKRPVRDLVNRFRKYATRSIVRD